MEYCSLLWIGAPPLHLAQIDAMETNAFKIIGISHDEAEPLYILQTHYYFHIADTLVSLWILLPPFW